MRKEMVLYFTPGACSLASHIALEESGLPFVGREVGTSGDISRADYLRVNPRGTVPALKVGETALTENIAILRYVGSLAPSLAPSDAWSEAMMLSRLAWFASTVHIAFRQTRRPERFVKDPGAYESVRAAGHDAFRRSLAEIDAMLGDDVWFSGEGFGVADGYALVFYGWALASDYEMSAYPAFHKFARRCAARPAVCRVLQRERSAMLDVL